MSIRILGISFSAQKSQKILSRVEEAFVLGENLRIATVNPEFLLEARKNESFRESLKQADIRTVDGVGIKLVALLRGKSLTRVTGADLLPALLTLAESHDIPLTIYNQARGLSNEERIRQVLGQQYPKLKISYNKELKVYSLILCAYGAPEQELFLDMLSAHGVKMGIGGALDYLTGRQKRAPKILRIVGLEWLWRLILQPKRLKRIWQATGVFSLAVIQSDILKLK